ncbi:PDZ domain-containing protein 8-like [Lytechinus variegatus]|uniref:PDZ domain-containing protein 8-like n=1 Tax=Lytechinus variegatus TaxID=7654 RepID=UPI001BB19C6B|nr:PDZ domain-containing protein 8-like [Lytechinus variegatus]
MFFIIILSVFFGGVLMLAIQALWLYWYIKRQPKEDVPRKHLYDRVKQVGELKDPSSILFKKESCNAANALISFLFNELKDTLPVRRWIIKKMNVEFEELLNAKTAGKILEQITVRDYCLGPTFPTLTGVTLMKFSTAEGTDMPETVDVAVDIDYGGGFRVSVDVDLVFGTSAYVSVIVTKLKGRARLEFTRNPYSHWSFSFYEEPELEFDIETHFEGRTVHQLGSLILNQLRKTMRKKHTLPAYKIRSKPFFPKPVPPSDNDFRVHDSKITIGRMQVTVIECSRLPISKETTNSELYITLCLDDHAWTHEDIEQRFHGDSLEIEIPKGNVKNVGVTFSRGIYNKEVIVATISPDSTVAQTQLRKGDVVVSIDEIKVTSARQAAKVVKQAKEKFVIKVQRPMNQMENLPASSAAYDQPDLRSVQDTTADNDYEDFINVNIMNELGIKDDDEADASQPSSSTAQRLQVPSLDSPVVQRKNKQPTTADGRRLSSCLDYETVKQLSTQLDNEDRLRNLKRVIKETIHPTPKVERPKEDPTSAIPIMKSEAVKIPDIDLDAISVSSLTSQMEDVDSGSVGPSVSIAPSGSEAAPPMDDMQETCLVAAEANPEWDETFTFQVGENDNFLNACIWNRLGMAVGERDMLIGYTSVCLMDVALQCVSTLSGEHLELFKLQPPEQRGGATRITSQMHLFTHPGFDSTLSYGDISLFFHHSPFEDPPKPTKEGGVERPDFSPYDTKGKPKVSVEEKGKPVGVKKITRPEDLSLHGPVGQPHKLVGTQFSSPTRCDFCGKKVWTKYALQCLVCKLICHKKCSEKTQASIPCDRNRAARRTDQSSPTRELSQTRQLEAAAQSLAGAAGRRGTPHPSPSPSPAPSPHESEEEDEEEEDVEAMVRRLSKLKRRLRQLNAAEGNRVDDTDAMVMTAVREMGRELFIDSPVNERKEKLEAMIEKLQTEIDEEADRQLQLAKEVQMSRRRKQKQALEGALAQSEERMQTLANLMLHYCAGIQHCNETL